MGSPVKLNNFNPLQFAMIGIIELIIDALKWVLQRATRFFGMELTDFDLNVGAILLAAVMVVLAAMAVNLML